MKVEDVTGGKYYRTELVITLSDGRMVDVELSSGDPTPSYLEGDDSDYSGGHYEREATRIVADLILAMGK